ncbi:MAG: hypothetical protein IJ418_02635 [Clostridia bacterium]|nr:hypothetical protein [Clostridia bacterium]
MVTVAGFRAYLNPPPDVTDDQLTLWLAAAKSDARTSGVPEYKNNAEYDLFIYSLGAWHFDNRGMRTAGTSFQSTSLDTYKRLKDSFVLQLRHATEDEDGG